MIMECVNCGKYVEDDSGFCYYCGCDPTRKDKDGEGLGREVWK